MSKGTAIDLGLTGAYNDLFSTQEERDNAGRTFVTDLDPAKISDFPNHPFHVRMDEEMERLVESVKERGVLSPVLVRPMPEGGYQTLHDPAGAGGSGCVTSTAAPSTGVRCGA